jgi:hypothetical protein
MSTLDGIRRSIQAKENELHQLQPNYQQVVGEESLIKERYVY